MRYIVYEEPFLNYITSYECDSVFQAIQFFNREYKEVMLCKRMPDGSWVMFAKDRQTGIESRYTVECE